VPLFEHKGDRSELLEFSGKMGERRIPAGYVAAGAFVGWLVASVVIAVVFLAA
jgi:hypothetical protein